MAARTRRERAVGLGHGAAAALVMALGRVLAQDPSPAPAPTPDPVAQQMQELIDRFHAVMPRNPAELRRADARKQHAPAALPVLRAVRTFVERHPDTQLGKRAAEFTVWALVLGDDAESARLRARQAAGDASARLLLDSSAVIVAADEPQRAAAIAAAAKGFAPGAGPGNPAGGARASDAALDGAAACLLMAGDLSAAEAGALARTAAVPAVAKRFRAAADAAAKDARLSLDKPVELAGRLLTGAEFSTTSLRGQVVLVDFWATWCGPCVRGLPELVELRRKHGERGLAIVGVSSDRDRGALERFLAERPELDWPQLFAPDVTGFHPLAERFGITAIPRLFLIDRKGVLRSVDAHGKLDELVARLLAE